MTAIVPTRDHGADNAPALFTVTEACAVLRISRWMLYQLIRSNQLHTIKIGSRRLIPASSIHLLLDQLVAGDQ